MKRNDPPCTSLPVSPDCFCWSTAMATIPAVCTCIPAGGFAAAIVDRRSSMSVVIAPWSLVATSDSTWSCAACPDAPFGAGTADCPRSRTLVTVLTLPRSVCSVLSQSCSAALNVPEDTAATTGTGVTFSDSPSGAAKFAACWLGALAGRKSVLLPCVTLASEGSAFGIATAAAIQTMRTTQRNLTANLPIARKMSSACTRPRIAAPRSVPRPRLSLVSVISRGATPRPPRCAVGRAWSQKPRSYQSHPTARKAAWCLRKEPRGFLR